jgi:hypothetical protein
MSRGVAAVCDVEIKLKELRGRTSNGGVQAIVDDCLAKLAVVKHELVVPGRSSAEDELREALQYPAEKGDARELMRTAAEIIRAVTAAAQADPAGNHPLPTAAGGTK